MGRFPLLIVLILQVAVIMTADLAGWGQQTFQERQQSESYSAYVLETREAETSGLLLVVEIDSVASRECQSFKARVHIVSEAPKVYPGQRIGFGGKLKKLPDVPPVPDIIDLQRDLRRQGVVATAVVPLDSLQYIASANEVKEWFARVNETLTERLMRARLSPDAINILAAVLLGHGEMLPDNVRADYTSSGLAHVLALSGLHVGIISMIIAFALWPFYLGRHVRTRLLLTILALWFYAALTGFIPSVTRAVIMALVYMVGRILQRKSSAVNSLCLAAILILLFSPHDIYAVGFQLSFAAVLGIILFYPLINRVDRREHPIIYLLVSYPALSLSAMTFAGIISVFYFHVFPVYFLISNIAIVPIVPLLIIAGVLSVIFEVNFGVDMLCRLLDGIAGFISSLPGAVIAGLYPSVLVTAMLCLLLVMFAIAAHLRHRFMVLEAALLFIGVIVLQVIMPRRVYPDKEEYYVAEYRSNQKILVERDSCFVYTSATLPSDIEEIEWRYGLLLEDFMAKRGISGPYVKTMD